MTKLIRFLAVLALALSPVWGVQTVVAASSPAPAHYPTFPSYASSGCATAVNGYITCGGNGIILTQVNSGYACSAIVVSFDGVVLQQQPLVVTVTANSGSFNSNFSVSGDGDYSVNIPGFLVNNLAVIQITASTGGSFFLSNVGVSTCAVPSSTATANPSDTATNTPVPVTGTPTSVPTFTPIPVTHNTFTPSATRTGTITPLPSPTPTVTTTPIPGEFDCGEPSFPVLNCYYQPGDVGDGSQPDHWVSTSNSGSFLWSCSYHGSIPFLFNNVNGQNYYCSQSVTATVTGELYILYNVQILETGGDLKFQVSPLDGGVLVNQTGCTPGNPPCLEDVGLVSAGSTYDIGFTGLYGSSQERQFYAGLQDAWVQPSGAPATSTITATPSSTVTHTPVPGTATATGSPTNTPVPIPGAQETAIPTSTECPGGCVVTALTAIPGMATRTMVDTSPFSALTHLTMARSSCAPFGYVQIPYPVITGTPVMGEPLNFGWTVPVTHTWDNTNPLSNTAIQPCAMSEIPSGLWDFTYWFSVFGIATVFIMWLIGLVGRLSGEETING